MRNNETSRIVHLALFDQAQSKMRVLTTCSDIVLQTESTLEPKETTCLRCIVQSTRLQP